MTIHYKLEFADLLAFQRDVIKNSRTHHVKQSYFKWIGSLVLFFVIFLTMGKSFPTFAAALITAIIVFVLFPILYSKFAFSKFRKQMQRNDYSNLLDASEMSFTNVGITRKTGNKTTDFEWDKFEKATEDNAHFYLYVSDLQGLIIPKRADGFSDGKMAEYIKRINS